MVGSSERLLSPSEAKRLIFVAASTLLCYECSAILSDTKEATLLLLYERSHPTSTLTLLHFYIDMMPWVVFLATNVDVELNPIYFVSNHYSLSICIHYTSFSYSWVSNHSSNEINPPSSLPLPWFRDAVSGP